MQNLPAPIELNYNGQKVLSNRQLTQLFGCSRQTIDGIFRNHAEIFEKGVDYFKLVEEDLRAFKIDFSRKVNLLAAGKQTCVPFSSFASCLYLWTQEGVLKLSKFIGTDRAKIIYTQLALGYFQEKPKIEQLPEVPQIEPPKISSNTEKIEPVCIFLDKLTALCSLIEDKKLRDDLIKTAFALIDTTPVKG